MTANLGTKPRMSSQLCNLHCSNIVPSVQCHFHCPWPFSFHFVLSAFFDFSRYQGSILPVASDSVFFIFDGWACPMFQTVARQIFWFFVCFFVFTDATETARRSRRAVIIIKILFEIFSSAQSFSLFSFFVSIFNYKCIADFWNFRKELNKRFFESYYANGKRSTTTRTTAECTAFGQCCRTLFGFESIEWYRPGGPQWAGQPAARGENLSVRNISSSSIYKTVFSNTVLRTEERLNS